MGRHTLAEYLPNKFVVTIKDYTPKEATGMYLWFSEGIPAGTEFTIMSPPKDGRLCVKLNQKLVSPSNPNITLEDPLMWIPMEYFEEEKN